MHAAEPVVLAEFDGVAERGREAVDRHQAAEQERQPGEHAFTILPVHPVNGIGEAEPQVLQMPVGRWGGVRPVRGHLPAVGSLAGPDRFDHAVEIGRVDQPGQQQPLRAHDEDLAVACTESPL